jgi:site-specific recombinase XerD
MLPSMGMAEPSATAHTPAITPEPTENGDRGAVPPNLEALVKSWERSLRAERKAPKTIKDYLHSTRCLARHLAAAGMPTDPPGIHRGHVEAFIVAELERTSPSSAASAYRRIQQWFRWLVEEGEITASPMVHMSPPKVDDVPVPVIALEQIRRLFAATAGQGFTARRDTAVLRVLFDTGVRRAECAAIVLADVDLDAGTVSVRGKGGKYRILPLGAKTIVAIDRYLRVRAKHPYASSLSLWLGQRGPVTGDGVRDIVDKVCAKAKVDRVRPHQFRHTLAHRWRVADGNETDLMQLMGWESPDMLRRYGKSAAAERARASHRRLALGDEV